MFIFVSGLGLPLGVRCPVWVEDVRVVVVCERRPDNQENRIKRKENFAEHCGLIDEVDAETGLLSPLVIGHSERCTDCRKLDDIVDVCLSPLPSQTSLGLPSSSMVKEGPTHHP